MSRKAGLFERAERLRENGAEYHADVVAFLSSADAYPTTLDDVRVIETHTALVFIAGDRVYKLKRPIQLDFLDNRSLAARRQSCECELKINQRLAPEVYLGVVPVAEDREGKLALGGSGTPIDWVVVMRRLEETEALDRMIVEAQVTSADLDRICEFMSEFYRSQDPIELTSGGWINLWRDKIAVVHSSLTDPLFALPDELTLGPLSALDKFLSECRELIVAGLTAGRIVDGHGDLKAEHIYLSDRIRVIDRLEFDERLRWCDPFDEFVFLGLECSRLGAPWIGPTIIDKLAEMLGERPPEPLLRFYWIYRGCMRARLMIEHLRDGAPRTPELWPRKARAYLKLASEGLPKLNQS